LGISADHSITDLAFDIADDMRVFVATSSGIVKSTDTGESWQIANGVIPDNGQARCMIEDPRSPHTLFFGGGQTIYYSSDAASSADIIAQIPQGVIQSLAFDQRNGKLLVGTTAGVFVLPIGT
jgi:hypothetical protein